MNINNIKIEHRPNGPYADQGLEWYYTWGGFDGWAQSEEAADERITTYIKSQKGKKKK